MSTFSRLSLVSSITFRSSVSSVAWKGRIHTTRPKAKSAQRRARAREEAAFTERESTSGSDDELISLETQEAFAQLEAELEETDDLTADSAVSPPSAETESPQPSIAVPDYRMPHCFVGFDPRRMDLEDFPRLRTDFDGKRGGLMWMGTECQRCGLQIRRERRTNRETSLNIYANPGIPDDLLRHCPERKVYPVLWRSRDPYVILDVLGVEDF